MERSEIVALLKEQVLYHFNCTCCESDDILFDKVLSALEESGICLPIKGYEMKTTVQVNKHGEIPLDAFKDFVDIAMVKYYKVKALTNGTIRLTFYDTKKRLIKVKEQEKK